MKKLFRNRTVLACVSILLAALLVFVAAPLVQKNAQKETDVYVTKAAVQKGSVLEESQLKVVSVPAQYLPAGAMTEKEKIIGQYAKTDLIAGDYVLADKLSKTPTVENDWVKDLSPDRVAISVSIKSFAAGLSAKLQPGDIVSFVVTGSDGSAIPPALQYVQLAAVTTDKANDHPEILPDSTERNEETIRHGVTIFKRILVISPVPFSVIIPRLVISHPTAIIIIITVTFSKTVKNASIIHLHIHQNPMKMRSSSKINLKLFLFTVGRLPVGFVIKNTYYSQNNGTYNLKGNPPRSLHYINTWYKLVDYPPAA